MRVDLHEHSPCHVVVDEGGLRLLQEAGLNPFAARVFLYGQCPCDDQLTTANVTLLGFLVGPGGC